LNVKRCLIFVFLGALFLAIVLNLIATPRLLERNDRYRPGDWVSFGVARYISSVAVGPEYTYFGSSEGLLRYDILRNRWEAPYTTSDGLADNQIFAVAYDIGTGLLWCSTRAGVSSMHPASYRWTNYSKGNIGTGQFDEILSIGIGRRFVWFETRARRLFNVSKLGNVIVAAGDTANDNIFWYGVRARRPRLLPHFFVPAGYIFDPNGVFQDFRLRRADVTGFVRDQWDSYWMGTWGLGVWRANVHIERADILAFGLAQRRVDALALDERGLWIGGRNDNLNDSDAEIRGITYWRNPSTISFGASEWKYHEARYNLDMSSDEVNRFEIAEGKLFCATEDGVNIYDPKKDRWRRIVSTDGLLSARVNDVAVFNGYLWAATDLGLNRVTLSTIGKDTLEVKTILPEQLLYTAVYDVERTENLLWIGTQRGPFIYDVAKSSGGFLADNLGPRDEPTLALSHSDSLIWFGTTLGVEVFDRKNKIWLTAPARQRFPNASIKYVLAQPEAVWVGTDAGVYKYNRQRQDWRQFTTEDGLIDNRVNAITVQDDWIWFGTPAGLTAFRWNDPHRID
jgi:ligand-binding sensor domain-containing protein